MLTKTPKGKDMRKRKYLTLFSIGDCWFSEAHGVEVQPRIMRGGKRVSRLILEERHGRPLTRLEFACHTCANGGCINPHHLYLGTPSENSIDRSYDQKWGVLKLKPEDIPEIRRLIAAGERGIDIAEQFGVSPQTICDIKMGRTWVHVK